LRKHSDERIATNVDFGYIRQDIDQFKKTQLDKTTTLNEHDAIKEHEAHQVFLDAHERERVSRKPSDVKIYDITVENADDSGLPAQETNSIAGSITETNNTNHISGAKQNVTGTDAIEFQQAETARLEETEQILEDYISLLSKSGALIADH
jgi:hypothetical protein